MLKWLSGLIGSEIQKAVTNDFKRLNDLKAGLGDAIGDYVCRGENGTALSTLAIHCKANELKVLNRYSYGDSAAELRRKLLAHADPYPHDAIHRYAEVLAAVADLSDAPGTSAVPKIMRVLFGEMYLGLPIARNTWPQETKPLDGKGFTLEVAHEMLRRLGGSPADLIDVVYTRSPGYSAISGELYRKAVDLRPAVDADPDSAFVAARRMPAAGRAELIRDIARWRLSTDPRFTAFLVEQAGDGAKATREAACAALAHVDSRIFETAAVALLRSGNVEQRAGMVELLGKARTPEILETLRAHRENEKTARVVAAIETALAIAGEVGVPKAEGDDAHGYTAIDGQKIPVPALVPLVAGSKPKFGESDRDALLAAIEQANARARQQNAENERNGYKYKAPFIKESMASDAVSLLNGSPPPSSKKDDLQRFLSWGVGASWVRGALDRMSDADALAWSAWLCGSAYQGIARLEQAGGERIRKFLESPQGDLRHLESIDIGLASELPYGNYQDRQRRPWQKGDLLRVCIQDGWSYGAPVLVDLPPHAAWPYLAENLDVFDEALGIKPPGEVRLNRASAIQVLTLLPATPARFFAPLLETATQTSRAGRAEARALLGDRPEVTRRLITLLDDSRQALRAGAAEWLAQRKDADGVAALWARLRKEKSELARAAIVTALRSLGQDISTVVGPDALVAEAEKGLKSAKLDHLDWAGLDHLPRVRFRDGQWAPRELLVWWIFIACKLKQPGGNALFTLYLDQLDSDDAAAFSSWVLDTWIHFDTARPDEAAANAYANKHAQSRFQSMVRWYKDYTAERAHADLRNEFLSQYLNSGAETKGMLAMAVRAPSAMAADRVRAYLKNHGKRTSQAAALLEMLAAIDDPVALQVVIAAATRLKQKGVQEFAGQLVSRVAEARDWTLDELADRTIPTAGFDDDGTLRLVCGEDARVYEGRLTDELAVVLRNPAGKEVSGLPAGTDDGSKAARKQLTTTKKELKQIAAMQTARLYEALCAERSWTVAEWRELYWEHPVMRRLVERVVWMAMDDDGALAGTFRPTAEGDLTDLEDQRVTLDRFSKVRLAHGALLPDSIAKAWAQHLEDYGIKPLFAQFGRSLLRIETTQSSSPEIDDRKGWLTDTFTLRGAATKLGYERGEALDGGAFNEYRKNFSGAGITAVVEFTGSSLPEENIPAALITLKFVKATRNRSSRNLLLGEVPPVLLSECWNDYRAMAARATYDPEWQRKGLW